MAELDEGKTVSLHHDGRARKAPDREGRHHRR
jgi:hypothetical protein